MDNKIWDGHLVYSVVLSRYSVVPAARKKMDIGFQSHVILVNLANFIDFRLLHVCVQST